MKIHKEEDDVLIEKRLILTVRIQVHRTPETLTICKKRRQG